MVCAQVGVLHSITLQRRDDDDFVLASTAAALRLLRQPATCTALLANAELAAHWAELLEHGCREARGGAGGTRGGAPAAIGK